MLERLARRLVDRLDVLAVDLRSRACRRRPRACARSSIGECWRAGVDSAQWLFSQTKTAGTFQSCARLSDSWKVPMFVAPSPKNATATRGSSRSLKASAGADDRRQPAADDRVRAEVAALDVVEVHRAAVAVRAALELPVQLGHDLVRVRALARACARARGASRR